MVIGGIANAVWGNARATTDVDVSVACAPEDHDVADLLRRRRDSLDREYLDPHVHELAVILERPELEERYRGALA